MITLTEKEIKIMEIASREGFIDIRVAKLIYSGSWKYKFGLKKLVSLKLLNFTEIPNKLFYTGKDYTVFIRKNNKEEVITHLEGYV